MSAASNSTNLVKLRSYLMRFGLVYVIAGVAVGAALTLLHIDGNSGVSIAVLASASYAAVQKFVQDQKRLFLPKERRNSALYATIWSLLLTALMVIATLPLLFSRKEISEFIPFAQDWLVNNSGIAAIGLVVGAIVSWLVIFFTTGWAGRQVWRTLPIEERFAGRRPEL